MDDKTTKQADYSIEYFNKLRWVFVYMALFISLFTFGTITAFAVSFFAFAASMVMEYVKILKYLYIRQKKAKEKQQRLTRERLEKILEEVKKSNDKT